MKRAGNNPTIKLDLVNKVRKAGKTVVYPTRDNPKLSKPEPATFKVKFQPWYSSILCTGAPPRAEAGSGPSENHAPVRSLKAR